MRNAHRRAPAQRRGPLCRRVPVTSGCRRTEFRSGRGHLTSRRGAADPWPETLRPASTPDLTLPPLSFQTHLTTDMSSAVLSPNAGSGTIRAVKVLAFAEAAVILAAIVLGLAFRRPPVLEVLWLGVLLAGTGGVILGLAICSERNGMPCSANPPPFGTVWKRFAKTANSPQITSPSGAASGCALATRQARSRISNKCSECASARRQAKRQWRMQWRILIAAI